MAAKQRKAKEAVISTLKTKYNNGTIKTLEEEISFLAGAMVVLNAIYGKDNDKLPNCIPPNWIFSGLAGKSILDEE